MESEKDSNKDDYLDTELSFLKDLFQRENERGRSIESKATSLLGFTGVMLSLTLGLGKMLIDLESKLGILLVPLSITYVCVVVISFFIVLFSWLTIKVTYFQDVSLDTLKHEKSDEMKKDWIKSLEKAYLFNLDKTNKRINNFLISEKLFVIATVGFVIIAAMLLLHIFPINIDC